MKEKFIDIDHITYCIQIGRDERIKMSFGDLIQLYINHQLNYRFVNDIESVFFQICYI